jgi:hypothetical protein
VGRPRGESRGVSRERARYGYTQIVQVAEVGRTHRASCPPGGRKASWRARALAGRKLEAPPDAGHEPREGEPVRGRAQTIKRARLLRLVGFGSQALDTTEGVPGLSPVLPSPAIRRGVLRLAGQSSVAPSARSVSRTAHRSARRAARACLRVTTGTSDGRHGSVKAPQGPRRTEGSSHPRR